jgi:hypothetical protein
VEDHFPPPHYSAATNPALASLIVSLSSVLPLSSASSSKPAPQASPSPASSAAASAKPAAAGAAPAKSKVGPAAKAATAKPAARKSYLPCIFMLYVICTGDSAFPVVHRRKCAVCSCVHAKHLLFFDRQYSLRNLDAQQSAETSCLSQRIENRTRCVVMLVMCPCNTSLEINQPSCPCTARFPKTNQNREASDVRFQQLYDFKAVHISIHTYVYKYAEFLLRTIAHTKTQARTRSC